MTAGGGPDGARRGEGTILFGGSGFIGSHILALAPAMVSVGRTPPPTGNRHLPVETTADLAVLEGESFDSVICAIGNSNRPALVGSAPSPGIPSAYDYHLTPLVNVLEQLADRPLRGFAHISTVLLYDRTAPPPFAEDAPIDPFRDRHVFAKHLAEQALRFYGRRVPCLNVRMSNVYGPSRGERHDLVDLLCRQVAAVGRARIETTRGERDFIHVEDAARAVLMLVEAGATGDVNVATGTSTPVARVREIAEEVSGGEVEVVEEEGAATGSDVVRCDVGRLERLTGWSPRYAIEDGVRDTYEQMRADR